MPIYSGLEEQLFAWQGKFDFPAAGHHPADLNVTNVRADCLIKLIY